jgi:hypothetical protein
MTVRERMLRMKSRPKASHTPLHPVSPLTPHYPPLPPLTPRLSSPLHPVSPLAPRLPPRLFIPPSPPLSPMRTTASLTALHPLR